MHATHGQPPPAEALARIDEYRRRPNRSERAPAMLDRLGSDGLWSKLPPALRGREAALALVDIAVIAFGASDSLEMPFPRHRPQAKKVREKLMKAVVENLRPDKGPTMTAEFGQLFLDKLKENEADLRTGMGSSAYDDLCSMIGTAIGALREIAAQTREMWQALGLPPPPPLQERGANTRRGYFVAVASKLIEALMGRPHDVVVAALANIAYPPHGAGIGADAVRKRRERV